MSMPMSPATAWFCAVARMATPSLVRYTRSSSSAIMRKEPAMMPIWTLVMVAPFGESVRW
jgi:hypothetical protein